MFTHHNLGIEVFDSLSFRLTLPASGTHLADGGISLWQNGVSLEKWLAQNARSSGSEPLVDRLGQAQRWTTSLDLAEGSQKLRLTLAIDAYEQWPDAFILSYGIENLGEGELVLEQADCPKLRLAPPAAGTMWSFQGAAVAWGQDFAFELPVDFERANYLGHVDGGEGGGIPLVYCWNASWGLALAHIEPQQKDWFMPVRSSPDGVSFSLQNRQTVRLQPGEFWQSLRALISYHQGDFYAPLELYRQILARQGVQPAEPDPEDYEPAWCSWGYEFDVKPAEVTAVLPALKELGIHWLTLDDRWFDYYGDWNPRQETFPGGERRMREMVDDIHRAGAYAQLWWYPLAVEDGDGTDSGYAIGRAELLRQHADWLILNEDGSPARNNRGLLILDPSLPEVQAYIAGLTRRFIQDWDYDGHKLDNIYTVPACYNPAHHHHRPEESTEGLAEAYRIIFETTRKLKPHSVNQICPCGTPPTISWLPYMDQAVTADPTSSAQVRQRIKFYKALLGPQAAVFADHVELTDNGLDFASGVGPGGIPATKFVLSGDPSLPERLEEWWGLSPDKLAEYKRWFELYRSLDLARGEYLNLYDLAFDRPEAHAIRKDGKIVYAFYAGGVDQVFQGSVVLRGLEPVEYELHDILQHTFLGTAQGPEAALEVEFTGCLLVEATPAR